MLSLLGSLLGFGTSFLPSILDFFKQKSDQKHELAIMDKQIAAAAAGHNQRLEEINIEADIEEIKSLHRHDQQTNVRWIDGLRGSVRPVITYLFFLLFMSVEIAAYLALLNSGVNAGDAIQLVWDDEVMALFAAVMSFWFGGRAMAKYHSRA